eukprot:CAMPEP_0206149376 /NCGR_PEP_ID=MMETSP1473-20131121/37745_1 /ASSEMBLY_ACC=CAM_ASM_001109 /TAXON_ID=1461547 /ORGANISM="Stichococcus sp, Strain RCC1054" /LENGTH=184 /DNA_ID=CAMNT_0053546837 /DNA_START=733 /DNA_END=1287 /DNA_ORIENTATION=+
MRCTTDMEDEKTIIVVRTVQARGHTPPYLRAQLIYNKQLGIVPCAAQMASVNLSRLGGSCSVVRPERVLPSQLPAPQRVAHRWSRLVRSAQITLKTPDGTVTLEVDEGQYILDAAEDAGMDLPYSCRAGACSSCVAIMEDGQVDQTGQTFLDDEQIADGFILTCIACPQGDSTIITHMEDEMYN